VATESKIKIKGIRLTDLSVETASTTAQNTHSNLNLGIDLNIETEKIQDNEHKVKLIATAKVIDKQSDKTLLLIEVEYSLWLEIEIDKQFLNQVLYIKMPEVLFPYVRETLDSMALKAGFASLNLVPFNFENHYRNTIKKQQEQTTT